MSDIKYPAALANTVGIALIDLLAPHCEMFFASASGTSYPLCQIAGSLRRKKSEVGDIEIVYVSKIVPVMKPGEMFHSDGSAADIFINELLGSKIEKRLSIDGKPTWGPLNKLAVHKATGIPIDFFATTREDWFRTLVIRTGPKDFNIRLIMEADKRGKKIHAYGNGVTEVSTGEIVPVASEKDFLALAGIPWTEPQDRK